MSVVNVSEVVERMLRNGQSSDQTLHEIRNLRFRLELFTLEQAASVAQLRPLTRHVGVSLGDRACLALARERQVPVITSDQRWAELNIGVEVRLIR